MTSLFALGARDALGHRLQRFCEQPDSENGLAGFVQHVQSPFGIFRQSGDNVLCQIGAHAQRRFARGVMVAQDIFEGERSGKLALLHLEQESRHFVS
jgi:hypothetical protein